MRGWIVLGFVVACGGGGGGGTGGDAAHDFCITETNRYRAAAGRPAVTHSQQLEDYADEGAMIDFSSSAHDHFSSTSGGGIAFAENECPQQGNWRLPASGDISAVITDCITAFYLEGAGGFHYMNMMGPYAKLGCGIYVEGDRITIIQDFGN